MLKCTGILDRRRGRCVGRRVSGHAVIARRLVRVGGGGSARLSRARVGELGQETYKWGAERIAREVGQFEACQANLTNLTN